MFIDWRYFVIRLPAMQEIEETNNLVPESHEVNRAVTHSYQVNRAAKRYTAIQPSLRGEPLHNSLRVTQNSTSSRWAVTYKNFVAYSITASNPVHSANRRFRPVPGSSTNGGLKRWA